MASFDASDNSRTMASGPQPRISILACEPAPGGSILHACSWPGGEPSGSPSVVATLFLDAAATTPRDARLMVGCSGYPGQFIGRHMSLFGSGDDLATLMVAMMPDGSSFLTVKVPGVVEPVRVEMAELVTLARRKIGKPPYRSDDPDEGDVIAFPGA